MNKVWLLSLPAVLSLLATPAGAQMPRRTDKAAVKGAALTVEHGAPPWNDDRLAQLETMLPVGAPWRAGADGPTSLTIAGAPVMIGGHFLTPRKYGLNLKRLGDKEWAFLIHDQPDAASFTDGEAVEALGSARFDNPEASERLMIGFGERDGMKSLELMFGPILVWTSIAPVSQVTSSDELNGNAAKVTWYRFPVKDTEDLSRPILAAEIEMELGDSDCPMRVYLSAADGKIRALFRNVEREDYERSIVAAKVGMEQFAEAARQQGIDAESRSEYRQFRRSIQKAEMWLEDLQGMPDNLEFSAATAAVEGKAQLSGKFTRKDGKCQLVAQVGQLQAVIPIDESRFAMQGN